MLPAEYKEMWIQTERGEKNITEINRGSGARSGIKLWVADWRGFPFRNGKLLRSTCRHNLSTSTVQLCKSAQTATASELWLLYPVKMFYVDLYLCNSVAHILIYSHIFLNQLLTPFCLSFSILTDHKSRPLFFNICYHVLVMFLSSVWSLKEIDGRSLSGAVSINIMLI